MLSTLLNLFYQSFLITASILVLVVGVSLIKDLWGIYRLSAIYANAVQKVLVLCVVTVKLVATVFIAIVILRLLIGGGTNAL